ncbi:MAG: penicillin-binding transpeptidase domain-containing protein, partial [Anaerolineales bacterium]
PLFFNPQPYPIRAPHFVWMVKAELDALQAKGLLPDDVPLVVRTSLDLAAQQVAEDALTRQLAHLRNDGGFDHQVSNAAVVVLDPHTGDLLALVGSADYFNAAISGAINMALIPRQPGSAFKPFIYAAAFDPSLLPDPWTAATPILDLQTHFTTADGKIYTPQNYDGREHGLVPARVALASSFNIPAVAALNKVGVERMSTYAARFGITTLNNPADYDLSLALGGGRVSLLELTNAYAVFARRGRYLPVRLILEIQDLQGKVLYRAPQPQAQPVLDERIAWLISDILSDPLARQPGFGRGSTLQIERPAAVKTGTTTDFHDNWTIGYTPDLVVGVWVGNSDYRPMRQVTGLSGAAPIWQYVLRTLLRNRPPLSFARPSGLVRLEVCTLSGLLPTDLCAQTHEEWFLEETRPTRPDDVYLRLWQNPLNGQVAPAPQEGPVAWVPLTVLHLPAEAWDWARRQGWLLDVDLLGRPATQNMPPLWLLSPRPGDIYVLTDSIPRAEQRLHLQALTSLPLQSLTFWVDGHALLTLTSWPYEAWWPLELGEHSFYAEALTLDGKVVRSERVRVEVRR